MKKIKIYLSLFVIVIITTIGTTFDVVIPNVYSLDYNDQVLTQKDNLWHLGKNLSVGDSYIYKICDPKTIQTSASNYHYFTQGNDDHNSNTCYTIKLDFVNLLTSDENQINNQRDVWVVQAAIHEKNYDLRYSVFHIDTLTFEVHQLIQYILIPKSTLIPCKKPCFLFTNTRHQNHNYCRLARIGVR